eukprot:2043495-Amphidinium_carterae.1
MDGAGLLPTSQVAPETTKIGKQQQHSPWHGCESISSSAEACGQSWEGGKRCAQSNSRRAIHRGRVHVSLLHESSSSRMVWTADELPPCSGSQGKTR